MNIREFTRVGNITHMFFETMFPEERDESKDDVELRDVWNYVQELERRLREKEPDYELTIQDVRWLLRSVKEEDDCEKWLALTKLKTGILKFHKRYIVVEKEKNW